jgi:hypothetical protein
VDVAHVLQAVNTDGTIAAWKMSPTGQFKSYFLGNVGAGSGRQIAKVGTSIEEKRNGYGTQHADRAAGRRAISTTHIVDSN